MLLKEWQVKILTGLTYEDHDSIGPLVLDNIEINMVHVLPLEVQPKAPQPNFSNSDVVLEETTLVDFVAIEKYEQASKKDKLKATLIELFP